MDKFARLETLKAEERKSLPTTSTADKSSQRTNLQIPRSWERKAKKSKHNPGVSAIELEVFSSWWTIFSSSKPFKLEYNSV